MVMIEKPASPKKSRGELIAEQLEDAVINGGIAAGSRLDEASLATQFGVSRTPVREALHILCGRGLAGREAFKGVVVTPISDERIDEMFEAMAEFEAMCGRLASLRMTMSERAELEHLHRDMSRIAEGDDDGGYDELNTRFHNLLFQGSRNSDLIAAAQALRLKLAPFRKFQLQEMGRIRQSCREHRQIVDAILDQDGKAAERALRRHLVSAAREVLIRRQRQDKNFAGESDMGGNT